MLVFSKNKKKCEYIKIASIFVCSQNEITGKVFFVFLLPYIWPVQQESLRECGHKENTAISSSVAEKEN
jgi:hypothetical protein